MESLKASEVYKAEEYFKAVAGVTTTLEGVEVEKGKVLKLSCLAILDVTTAGKTVRLGYQRAGTNYWVKRIAVGASGYGAELEGCLILVEGERPIGQVETPTANDELYLFARGTYLSRLNHEPP